MSTIYILWWRQFKKYFRSKSRIIGSLGQPALFLFVFGFGFESIYQKAGEGNYIQFLAPGIILMSVLFTAVFSGTELILDKQFGILKETLVAPVSRLQIILGRTLGCATVATIQGFIVFLFTIMVGFEPQNLVLLPVALAFVFLVALLFTALGTAIGCILEDTHGFQLIINLVVMPIFFLSGALFPLKDVPSVILVVAKFNPLYYGIDGLRAIIASQTHNGIFGDFSILLIVTLALLFICSYLFERINV